MNLFEFFGKVFGTASNALDIVDRATGVALDYTEELKSESEGSVINAFRTGNAAEDTKAKILKRMQDHDELYDAIIAQRRKRRA